VLTDVPPIAKVLVEKGVGNTAEFDADDFALKVAEVMQDEKYLTMREISMQMGHEFEWNKIFKSSLEALFFSEYHTKEYSA
jgi:alanine dehydrogenase